MRRSFFFAVFFVVVASAASSQPASPGLTPQALGQLVPQWWRWRVALPQLALPDRDAAGHFCDVGQSGRTWFLAAHLSFGLQPQPVHRACRIPAGRRLFFPVVTLERIVHGDITCSKASAQTTSGIDKTERLVATLDGADLLASGHNRWGSAGSCFPLNLPADGPSADLTAATDGYWELIGPLSPGHHTLVYGGALASDRTEDNGVQTTTYDLDVE